MFLDGGAQLGRHVMDGPQATRHTARHLRASSVPSPVGHPHLVDPPARRRRAEDHLQRPARPPIAEVQSEQGLPASGAHRPKIGQPRPGPAAAARGPAHGWPAARARARLPLPAGAPRGRGRPDQRAPDSVTRSSSTGSERSVAIHEADHLGLGRAQAGETRGAEARTRLVDNAARHGRRAIAAEPSREPLSTTSGR